MRVVCLATLIGVVACSHNELFQPRSYASSKPLGQGDYHQATFDSRSDLFPQWLPDTGAVIYTFQSGEISPPDRCLALIAPEGGTRQSLPCLSRSAPGDSQVAPKWPAAASDGRLAFVWSRPPGPDRLLLSTLAAPSDTQTAFEFPFVITGVQIYHTVTHLRWLNQDTLVAVGALATAVRNCTLCPFRPVLTGRDVLLIDITSIPATITVVPGTTPASAVEPGATGSDIYFTLGGDSKVYHRVLTTGVTSVTYDFGGAGIARDAQVHGDRLVAVVGGVVSFYVDSIVGPVQEDSGGPLHLVSITAATDSVLPDSGRRFRHPTISPTAAGLSVEGWLGGQADLWYFRLP